MARADEQWLSRLFDESGRRLLRYLAARLRDGTEGDDLAQEVYLRLLRSDDVLFIQDPRSFALRVATNVAYERGRLLRHRAVHTGTEVLEEQTSTEPSPLEQVAHAEEMKQLSRALERLSPTRRAVVLLHKRDGLTYEQIAAHVGLSVGMVSKHLAKGLNSCREFFAAESAQQTRRKGRDEHE